MIDVLGLVKLEEIFDIVHEVHLKKGHTGIDSMLKHSAGENMQILQEVKLRFILQ